MAENFDLIFGQNASQQYAWNDTDYQNGWETIGNIPPTAAQFDALQRRNDTKMKELNDELTPLVNADTADSRQPSTAYSVDDIKYSPLLPTGWFLTCTVGGTTSAGELVLPTPIAENDTVTDGTVTWTIRKIGSGGDGVPLGSILAYSANGELPSGYLLCDGRAVSRTMFPDLFAAIGTTYGAGDGSTTFNVPDYNSAKRFAQGDTVAGTVKQPGLPNIEGSATYATGYGLLDAGAGGDDVTGAFVLGQNQQNRLDVVSDRIGRKLGFDASAYNPIYGASNTVQPDALTCRYIIKAFDGQTADSALIDITQYAQELAGKADRDLDNLSATGEARFANIVKMPDWENEIAVTNTANGFVYTTPSNGYIKINRKFADGSSILKIYKGQNNTGTPLNSTFDGNLFVNSTQWPDGPEIMLIPVLVNEDYYIDISNISFIQISFIPFK